MTRCTCTWGTHVTTSYPVGVSAYGITATDPACPHHGSDPKEPTMPSKSKTYMAAVEWIGLNDEPTAYDPDEILALSGLTVALTADVWRYPESTVASDVARFRRAQAAQLGVQVD